MDAEMDLVEQQFTELTLNQFKYMKRQADRMEAYEICGVDNWIGADEAELCYREEFETDN